MPQHHHQHEELQKKRTKKRKREQIDRVEIVQPPPTPMVYQVKEIENPMAPTFEQFMKQLGFSLSSLENVHQANQVECSQSALEDQSSRENTLPMINDDFSSSLLSSLKLPPSSLDSKADELSTHSITSDGIVCETSSSSDGISSSSPLNDQIHVVENLFDDNCILMPNTDKPYVLFRAEDVRKLIENLEALRKRNAYLERKLQELHRTSSNYPFNGNGPINQFYKAL